MTAKEEPSDLINHIFSRPKSLWICSESRGFCLLSTCGMNFSPVIGLLYELQDRS